ncbi:polysaccharide biosynthesis/export family protein [Tropicimonas isoalkanivorans]|uniref:Polysaccharide export outer membrane protein n=1 Tax=Tropicimonas isoalkanivorans TaxID=441112 RepID=A0A1I1LKQ7_9RHOB|nr:polysaccharide biosynthesis/export family protein [Tropicimonas isoalkanivorans]SFC73704.1 polysaccharide export outer membrane protein [Tropicimonas isoalkanivorans]
MIALTRQSISQQRTHARLAAGLAVLCAALTFAAAPLWAGTAVARGDALRVEVLNAPDLSRDARVDADGRVMLPMLGGLDVAGKDVDQIRDLITRELRDRDIMPFATVLVEIAAYRPVYVNGDVSEPRAIEFSPGMTVRQAVVVAGGLGSPFEEDRIPPGELIGAIAELRTSAYALMQTRARIARLEAELADAESISDDIPGVSEVARDDRAKIVERERSLMEQRAQRETGASAHREAVLDLLELELNLLDDQGKLQDEEIQLQADEVANARSLVERGLMPRQQLQELLREKSQLSRDVLSTDAYAARARQAKQTAQFERLDERAQLKIELQAQLQQEELERVRQEAALEGQRARLLAAGVQIAGNGSKAELTADVTIHRTVGGKVQKVDATFDSAVEPGDVLDIKVLDESALIGG